MQIGELYSIQAFRYVISILKVILIVNMHLLLTCFRMISIVKTAINIEINWTELSVINYQTDSIKNLI